VVSKDRSPERKRIRLDREEYAQSGQIITITIGTRDRVAVFAFPAIASETVGYLARAHDAGETAILAYCLMPDHVHLLLRNDTGVDLVAFLQRFKSWTTRLAWRNGFTGAIWQRSFYDRILREDEDPAEQVRYILDNPVRAGISETWGKFPWAGSFAYDLSDPAGWLF
jgi:putative transposase